MISSHLFFKPISYSFHRTGLSPHWLPLFLGILFGAIINGIVLNFSGNCIEMQQISMVLYPTSKF